MRSTSRSYLERAADDPADTPALHPRALTPRTWAHTLPIVSKVQQIKAALEQLAPGELRELRERLDDFMEDHLPFTADFEAQIRQSEIEMTGRAECGSRYGK